MSLTNIKKYVDNLLPNVKNNIEILSTKDLGQNYVLHISKKNMNNKEYTPFISKRQAKSEDNTVVRVTCSDNLIGCIIGFSSLEDLAMGVEYSPIFKQGLYIHSIEFDYLLKPTNKLVFDQTASNELWLVPYDKDHLTYKAKKIGKIFISKITTEPVIRNKKIFRDVFVEYYLEVTDENGLKFSKNINLAKGYYKTTTKHSYHIKYTDNFDVISVTKEEYQRNKKIHASMLSYKSENLLVW